MRRRRTANAARWITAALLSLAGLQLDRDRAVTLDARKVRQVKVNVPKEATAVISRLDVRQEFSDSSTSTCTMLPGDRDYGFEPYDSVWALPTAGKAAGFAFGARFRLEQPALTLGTKTKTYKDLLVERAATPLPAGTRKLTAVFAGEGTAEDLARHDVHGKIAVVRRSDSVGIKEQAAAAAAAGARVLLVVNDGDGRLSPWDNITGSTLHPPALTVATLDADLGRVSKVPSGPRRLARRLAALSGSSAYAQYADDPPPCDAPHQTPRTPPFGRTTLLSKHALGGPLIDALQRSRVELTVTSHPTTDYVYDLVHHWAGSVPADPTWTVKPSDLARVDVSFRNYRREGQAYEFLKTMSADWDDVWVPLPAPTQGHRTDWVAGDSDWLDAAGIYGETGQLSMDVLHYPAGTTSKVSWFGPIQRPRMSAAGGNQPGRYLDTMLVPAPGWGDSGAGHVGDAYANFDVNDRETLYQGDQELDWSNAEKLLVAGLAPERLPYRLVVDNSRGTWANPYWTHTLTEWNFTSAATDEATPLPLIQLDYGVDTDEAGRADRHADLTVTASPMEGTTAAIGKVSLEVSYDDGATWQRPDLRHDGAGWRTALRAPKAAGFVSPRVTARDSDDDTVSQTITRAFGLR